MSPRYRPDLLAWEAVYTADLTLEQLRRRSLALGRDLAARGLSCLVAYDTRFMGQLLARDAALVIQAQGVRLTAAAAPVGLPALHHALEQRVADCALYISARNRPYHYNGLVLVAPAGHQLALDPAAAEPEPGEFPPAGNAPPEPASDIRAAYLDALRGAVDLDLIRRVPLTFFVDAMSGTGAGLVPALLGENGQTRAIEINREPDPLLGRLTPLPGEAGLNRLRKLVRESDSHLGLALSADATALGVVDKNGEQLEPIEVGLLLAAYLARQQRLRGAVVVPAPGPGSALAGMARPAAYEEASGLKVELAADPAARIAELAGADRSGLVLGCTAEGLMTIDRYAAYPDALLAGMLLVEHVARSGGSLRALIDAQRELLLRG